MDLYFWIPIFLTIAAVILSPWYHEWIASLMGKEQSQVGVVTRALEQHLSPENRPAVVEMGRNMDALDRSMAEFEENYYSLWKQQRRRTIHKLAEFRKNLDDVSTYVNASKTVGSTSSLFGSIGLVLSQYIPGASSYYPIAFWMRFVGDAIVPTSDHIGNRLSKDYIKGLKAVENDIDRTKHLRPSITQARKLNEDFSQLFKCNFLSDQKDMESALTDTVELHDTLARGVEIGLRERPGDVYDTATLSAIRESGDSYRSILGRLRDPRMYTSCKAAVGMAMDICGLDYLDIGQKSYFNELRNVLQLDNNDNLVVLCLTQAPNVLNQCLSLSTSVRIAYEGKSTYHEPLKYLEQVLAKELKIIEEKFPVPSRGRTAQKWTLKMNGYFPLH